MVEEAQQQAQRNWFTEGIVVALVPAVSYAIAFAFEAGYFNHFNLPLSLIEINLSGTIIAFFSLLVTLFVFYSIAELVNPFWGIMPQAIRSRLYFYIYFFFVIITNLVIAQGKPDGLQYIFYFLAVMAFFDFVLPAIPRRDGRRYLDRLANMHKRDLA